jgi:glycosidase
VGVPEWVHEAVFYQIFPDRFANGSVDNDPPNVQAWGAKPTIWGFQGGDLQGVIQHFDYLLDLGVNAIYFNPIFQATSNHRYNTSDYFRIDPKLGDMSAFHTLIELAHEHGVRIILDGVFNHCGRGFFAFQDILENDEHSPYLNWFHIRRLPVRAFGPGKAEDYAAWWGFKSLPKFNTDEAEVRRFLLGVARYWIEQGADGWRLDVPNEIDDDSFWSEFRTVVKEANPEAYLVGEIWEVNPRWVGEDHFDGLMNYPFRDALVEFLVKGSKKASSFAQTLEHLYSTYPRENVHAMMLSLGSHDTKRILTTCENDIKLVRLMNLLQFFFPGVPHIYYGDEVGLEGGKDPDCRKAFPWEEALWERDHRKFIQRLISIRQNVQTLRTGDFRRVTEDDDRKAVVFSRSSAGNSVVIALNASEQDLQLALKTRDLRMDRDKPKVDLLSGMVYVPSEGFIEIQLPATSGMILSDRDPFKD